MISKCIFSGFGCMFTEEQIYRQADTQYHISISSFSIRKLLKETLHCSKTFI